MAANRDTYRNLSACKYDDRDQYRFVAFGVFFIALSAIAIRINKRYICNSNLNIADMKDVHE